MKIKKLLLILGIFPVLAGCSMIQQEDTELISELSAESSKEYLYEGNCEPINIDTNDDIKIVLNNVEILSEDIPAITIQNAKSVVIEVIGENTLSDNNERSNEDLNAVIYSNCNISFIGEGTLNIEANYKHGIVSEDLSISNGIYNINAINDCIHSNNQLYIDGGTFSLTSESDECIQSENIMTINDGEISGTTSGDFFKAESTLEINGGYIYCDNCQEGIESKDLLIINGGDIYIRSIDDCINATNSIFINNGNIDLISSTNDAVDSNGTLEINGGTISAIALTCPEGAFDCDMNEISINGGQIFGLGNRNSEYVDNNNHTIKLAIEKETIIQTISIFDKNNNEILSYSIDDYSKDISNIENEAMPEFKGNGQMFEPRENNQEQGFDENRQMPEFDKNNQLIITDEKINSQEEYIIYINGELQN